MANFPNVGAALYAFLLDENALKRDLVRAFPSGRAKTVRDLGLEGKDDDTVLDGAQLTDRILVTVNRDDFVQRFYNRALALPANVHVPDKMHGLIVMSEDVAKRWNKNSLASVQTQMRLSGLRVTWRDVFVLNLFVRVRVDGVTIEYLPCRHCSGTADGFTDLTRPNRRGTS